MSIFDKLRSKPIEEANISNKTPEAKVIKRDWVRERPEHTTFERLIDYHDRTPQIRIAVASYSEMITGTDMNLTCKIEEAQKELADWIHNNINYDQLILEFWSPEDPNKGWIHCSYSREYNRKQYLRAYKNEGKTKYEPIVL